jgi:hypothetical protein
MMGMDTNRERILAAFRDSRKLAGIVPSAGQLDNVVFRLSQIFTREELDRMDGRTFSRQVERVWPIARYIDTPDSKQS